MKIVITSGYFNPVHTGHLSLLKEAAKLGDKLIVIVNNDKQVVLKGATPFMDEKSRLEIVKSLRWVHDAVIATDQDSSVTRTIALIQKQFRKDELIFANGGDRNPDNHVSSEVKYCIGAGIELAYGVGCNKVTSSSNLIEDAVRNKLTEWGCH